MCFLAAAVQALACADPLWDRRTWQSAEERGPHGLLAREVWSVVSEVRSRGEAGRRIDPTRLFRLLGERSPTFSQQGAHDAIECMEALISLQGAAGGAVAKCRRSITCPGPPWGCGGSRSRLEGQTVLRLRWEQEPEDGSEIHLEDLLLQAGLPATLRAGTHPGCPDCGCEGNLQQHLAWVEAPRVLIIQLERARFGQGEGYRDDTLIEAPRLGLPACGRIFDLAAQVLHSRSATAGHVSARVLRQGLWWMCDDGVVRSCPKRRVETPAGASADWSTPGGRLRCGSGRGASPALFQVLDFACWAPREE